MPTDHRAELKKIRTFPSLVRYLRDEMGWPIEQDSFLDDEELFYEFTPEELGLESKIAVKIESIKRLKRLTTHQPWGIFFVKFEPKKLPVVALRRILSRVALRKRASANSAERAAWAADDLLFISNYGEGDERQISFAHFSQDKTKADLPILKVLGWNDRDTALHLDGVATELATKLSWPEDESNVERWREKWRSAFTLRPDEVIKTSKALAVELAKLARKIRDRIRTVLGIETENGPVTKLMKAFQEALVHDLDANGFADMYAQTIAYGLLSARVTNPKANTADGFAAQLPVTNPFLKELMETFLHVGGRKSKAGRGPGIDFDELGVSEVVELLDDANMEAVVRDFGDKNPQEDPVIHFYELFAKEYDPIEKIRRGEFYTPRPVVSYIVRSVHELLQTKFGLVDGLADTATWGQMAKRHKGLTIPEGVKPTDRFVTILDPAVGTGTFLVEAIEVIHRTLVEKWRRKGHDKKRIFTLWNEYIPNHLLPRLHAYELKMAPYAIAHLKIGLKLHETGYRFESDERARIYLTNALEPAHDFSGTLAFAIPALAHEADAVNAVKRHQRFTVVIGNPPYSKASSNRSEYAESLVKRFKELVLGETNVQPLSDDYVKFLAFVLGVGMSRASIIGFITNRSYLAGLIHRGLRQEILRTCTDISIVDLHGDSNVGEDAPPGVANDNVFDITQGVAIALMLRSPAARVARVRHEDVWGTRAKKYAFLSGGVMSTSARLIQPVAPYFFFAPIDLSAQKEQGAWLSLPDLFIVSGMGLKSRRDHFLTDISREGLVHRFRDLEACKSVETLRPILAVTDNPQWTLASMRALVRRRGVTEHVYPLQYRPFDTHYIWYHKEAIERGDARWPVMKHVVGGGVSLLSSRQSASGEFTAAFVARGLSEMKTAESTRGSYVFPLYLADGESLLERGGAVANLKRELLGEMLGSMPPEQGLFYIYAILHSPSYRHRYAEALRIEFPRIPAGCAEPLTTDLARLGGDLVTLHLVEAPAQQALSARYDKSAKAWRYEVAKGQCLPVSLSFKGPEKPVVGKVGWSDDTVWIDAVKPRKGAGDAAVTGTVGFRGVPEEVWNFHIGGYQVCEKWLKDRKDRTLTAADIAHYHRIVIALHETIRLMREIDGVIDARGGWPGAFQGADASEEPTERVLKVAEPPGEYGSGKGKGNP